MREYKPWEEYPHFWKTESMFLSFIRGGIRRHLWAKNPIKLEFLKENRKRIVNPVVKGRKAHPTVWGWTCEQCGKDHKAVEVDHRTGEYSLRKITDIQSFVEGLSSSERKTLQSCANPATKSRHTLNDLACPLRMQPSTNKPLPFAKIRQMW